MNKLFTLKKAASSCLFFALICLIVQGCSEPKQWETVELSEMGNPVTKVFYLSDSKDSTMLVRKFHKNGNIKSQYGYEAGILQGPFVGFYSDGTIGMITHFVDGTKNQKEVTYYPSGSLRSNFEYDHGRCIGGSNFYLNGQPTGELVFDSLGYIKSGIYYHENGLIRSKGQFYPPNIKDGLWEYYFANGILKETGIYEAGKKRKNWILYDSLGNHRMTVPYH